MLSPPQSASNVTGPLAETVHATAAGRQPPAGPGGSERTMSAVSSSAGSSQVEEVGLSSVRFNWQLKAILPVVFVLLAGLLLFIVATVSFRDPERHAVLMVAGAGAVAICGVSLGAIAYFIQRPMVELQEKIALVSEGNLNVAVSFSKDRKSIRLNSSHAN